MALNSTFARFNPVSNLPYAKEGRLCVPLTGACAAELIAKSNQLKSHFPFQELRLDYLEHPLAAVQELSEVLRRREDRILLATCRRAGSGGRFPGTAAEEQQVLLQAARAGCKLVDLALETAEELGAEAIRSLRQAGAVVLLSVHDFEGPLDFEATYERMRQFAPDICKIVPTANSLDANIGLLRFLAQKRAPEAPPVVALLMGEAGVPSRVLGLRAGSAFTFAAATAAEATAPGQIDAHTLRELYSVETLNAATELYGVAGDPIATSKSPVMLNAAFRQTSKNAVYLPLLTRNADELLHFARELPLAGFSVTMPLKQTVLPLLDRVDPLAAKIGAVNTVRREPDGSFTGFNTDVAGIVEPLEERLSLQGARVLVLGAGGAARAAVFGCVDRGAAASILNRTYATAADLAEEAGATAIRHQELLTCAPFDVLLNATPAGMRGNATELPLAPEALRARLVFDTVYNPLDTPLLRAAMSRGLETISGLEMFVRQGARQFELWTGQPAPVDGMRAAVMEALHGSARS